MRIIIEQDEKGKLQQQLTETEETVSGGASVELLDGVGDQSEQRSDSAAGIDAGSPPDWLVAELSQNGAGSAPDLFGPDAEILPEQAD